MNNRSPLYCWSHNSTDEIDFHSSNADRMIGFRGRCIHCGVIIDVKMYPLGILSDISKLVQKMYGAYCPACGHELKAKQEDSE